MIVHWFTLLLFLNPVADDLAAKKMTVFSFFHLRTHRDSGMLKPFVQGGGERGV